MNDKMKMEVFQIPSIEGASEFRRRGKSSYAAMRHGGAYAYTGNSHQAVSIGTDILVTAVGTAVGAAVVTIVA